MLEILFRIQQLPHIYVSAPYSPPSRPVSFGWTARREFTAVAKRGRQVQEFATHSQAHCAGKDPCRGQGAAVELDGSQSCVEDGVVYRLVTGFKLLLQDPGDESAKSLPPGINGVQVHGDP